LLHKEIVLALMVATTPAVAQQNVASCIETAGSKQAARYAHERQIVAESRHAPCNAKNPCDVMIGTIRRGCGDIHYDLVRFPELKNKMKEPAFCKGYIPLPH
jgi:hypothetical protein